jgi:hypothetical protein
MERDFLKSSFLKNDVLSHNIATRKRAVMFVENCEMFWRFDRHPVKIPAGSNLVVEISEDIRGLNDFSRRFTVLK